MKEDVYTLGVWRVRPGLQARFVAEWAPFVAVLGELPDPPGTVTIIQSVSDPTLFYSFAPWSRVEDVDGMRADPKAQEHIGRLMDLCTEGTPGTFRVVARFETGREGLP